jgi:hypothetical protein
VEIKADLMERPINLQPTSHIVEDRGGSLALSVVSHDVRVVNRQ